PVGLVRDLSGDRCGVGPGQRTCRLNTEPAQYVSRRFPRTRKKPEVHGHRRQPRGGARDGGETRTRMSASDARATMYVWGEEGFDSVDGMLDSTTRPAPVCVGSRTT
ncbi:hypothetical protein, partial [Caballeronia choica]|uniref:hypothetical protein n=1 Tax=Caballeronia choica TaxID=326476 RepID=UPI001F340F51